LSGVKQSGKEALEDVFSQVERGYVDAGVQSRSLWALWGDVMVVESVDESVDGLMGGVLVSAVGSPYCFLSFCIN